MFYEPYRPKRRPSCLGRLFRIALVLLILWVAFTLAARYLPSINWIPSGENFSISSLIPSGRTDVLLLGADNEAERGRTDSIIIASIGNGTVKLTSVMRDTLVDMGEYGRHKINAAYPMGGAALALKAVNQAFGLNITRYAVINFQGFSDLIDSVDGVTVSVTKAEMQEINKGIKATWKRLGDGTDQIDYLETYGESVHLTGPQALAYARIRKIDSDYMRASRQRTILQALLKKVKNMKNPFVFLKLAKTGMDTVTTNMNAVEIGLLGISALSGDSGIQQMRLPAEGAYTTGYEDGVWVIKPDLEKNRQTLKQFLEGK